MHSDYFDGERLLRHFYRIEDIYKSIEDISKYDVFEDISKWIVDIFK